MRNKILFSIALALCLVGYTWSKTAVDKRLDIRTEIDIRRLPSPNTAKIAAIGFKSALADIFWIEAINYFGWQLTYKNRTYEYLTNYIELIYNLDPLFSSFYDWASTAYIYNAMPISRPNVLKAIEYANKGIINLNNYQRYDMNIISKGAFNYAIETNVRQHSLPYFQMAARIFPDKRDYLLVASSYATHANENKKAYDFKLEYLGFMAFQTTHPDEMLYVLRVLSSSKFNSEAANFTRALRLQMEKDDEIRKLIEKRLSDNPLNQESIVAQEILTTDKRVTNVLKIDFKKNWLPSDLHVLLSL